MCGGGSSGRRAGAATAARGASSAPTSSPRATCPQTEQARLVAVEWLNANSSETQTALGAGRDPTTELGGEGRQYVNFPRDARWERARVARLDRLGHLPPFRIRFNRPGVHHYRIRVNFRLAPRGRDYTTEERNRLPQHFDYTRQFEGHTRSDGTRVVWSAISVAAAGADRYRLEAEDDHGTRKQSKWLRIYRRVYYYVMKMQGVPAASNLSAMERAFRGHHIELTSLGEQQINLQANVNTGAQVTQFMNYIRPLFRASRGGRMVPHVLLVTFINYDADRKRISLRRNVATGSLPASITIPVGENVTATEFRRKPLWRNIDPADNWLISARYLRSGHPATDIASRCTPVGGDPCYQIRINTAGLPAGPGRIELSVNVADGFYNGGAYTRSNLITMSTRARWVDRPSAAQVQTLIHEIGHQFGFAPDGTSVDSVPFHYTGHGHRGNHCAEGLSATQRAESDYGGMPGTCVMFGENATTRRGRFCANCGRALRKQDLCRGWPMF